MNVIERDTLEQLPGVEEGLLRLELTAGVKAYSFTFG